MALVIACEQGAATELFPVIAERYRNGERRARSLALRLFQPIVVLART
jgi:hypothetical protein